MVHTAGAGLDYRDARKWAHITSGTNVIRETGNPTWLHSITVNTPDTGFFTIYNNGAGSGAIVLLVTTETGSSNKKTIEFDFRLDNGLTIVLSATMDLTVIYE